ARRCGVAQPSLTRAIQQLAQEFGKRLFERDNMSVRLTNLGTYVQPEFEQIDRATAQIAQKVSTFDASSPIKHDSKAREAIMRVALVAVVAVVVAITALTIRPAPHATAAAPGKTGVQINPYTLHSGINPKSLPDQDISDLY